MRSRSFPPRWLASSLGAVATAAATTTVAAVALSLATALLAPARVHAQVNGYDFANVADNRTGQFSSFGSGLALSLNASGQVAFLANLDAGGSGIYTSTTAGGLIERVIGTGDALFGSTVISAGFSREGLNDNGRIAFAYMLADRRSGIAVASAAEVIPEPGTLALVGLPFAAMAGTAIRRRRRNG